MNKNRKYIIIVAVLVVLTMLIILITKNNIAKIFSNNIEIIKNKKFFSLVKDTTLEQSNPESLFSRIDVACIFKKHILLANFQSNIKVFNSEGKFIKAIGRMGDGPGEFNDVTAIFPFGEYFGVYDKGKKKIHFYNLDGKFLRSVNSVYYHLRNIVRNKDKVFLFKSNTKTNNYTTVETDTNFSNYKPLLEGNSDFLAFTQVNMITGNIFLRNDSLLEINQFSNNILRIYDINKNEYKKVYLPKADFYNYPSEYENITKNSFDDLSAAYYKISRILRSCVIKNRYLICCYLKVLDDTQYHYTIVYDLLKEKVFKIEPATIFRVADEENIYTIDYEFVSDKGVISFKGLRLKIYGINNEYE
ncbi:MAG: hypothetical protein C0412_05755 [Flavobacterium sp.]|nr:hypothetical protein [Flavobacterium sp.]